MNKVYKFIGDYKKLKKLGFERMKMLEFDGYQMWSKVTSNYSIVIFNFVSVKVWNGGVGLTYTDPGLVKDYIKDLIKNNLVEVCDG